MLRNIAKGTAFGIALILVVIWLVMGSQSFHDCVHTYKYQNPYDNLHTEPSPLGRGILRLRLNAVCVGSSINREQGALTLLATAMIAWFTFSLRQSTDKLWVAGERQLRAMRQSVFISIASAKAARKSAQVAMAALGSERAWMVYDTLGVIESSNGHMVEELPDGSVKRTSFKRATAFNVVWRNRGRSPALGAVVLIDHKIVNFDDPAVPSFEVKWVDSTNFPIGPDATVVSNSRPFPDTFRDDLMNRKTAVLLFSTILYHDTFNSDIDRISSVCFKVRYDGVRTGPDGNPSINWAISAVGTQNIAT